MRRSVFRRAGGHGGYRLRSSPEETSPTFRASQSNRPEVRRSLRVSQTPGVLPKVRTITLQVNRERQYMFWLVCDISGVTLKGSLLECHKAI